MTTTDIGRKGEKIAANFLKKNGYRILETNKHLSHNEIDIIALNKEYILFVEVKTRTVSPNVESRFGPPSVAVDRRKQKRLLQAAKDYLSCAKQSFPQPRMDVIEVYLDQSTGKEFRIHHIPNAFGF